MEGYDYYKWLPDAVRNAAYFIQRYFTVERSYDFPDFRWLQTSVQDQGFQHLCFGFKNQVYSVIVAMELPDGKATVKGSLIKRQIQVCKANNMIPCLILMNYSDYSVSTRYVVPGPDSVPLFSSYNIDHVHHVDVNPFLMDLEAPVAMSDWECLNLAVQVVAAGIREEGGRILSVCDTPEVWPNICYKRFARECLVFVDGKRSDDSRPFRELVVDDRMRLMYKGKAVYKADVRISDANNLTSPVLRGCRAFVNYRGMMSVNMS